MLKRWTRPIWNARSAIFDIHHQIQALGMADAYKAAVKMKSSLDEVFAQIDKRLEKGIPDNKRNGIWHRRPLI